ncbi:thiamine pyrophosphate-dependent enzyme [Streptomyces sp. NBC_00890]|nr:thiamine pyrophosphate-dependent enzyme [Streptomyces sp. NBC_00891]WSY09964.1 thiamine pyrophosphate-dependent enzyme [Streptomyces sp. NBC_00890]WSZ11586.1 thiamine pyrophosphate-dependent enzyme [Streptomyces sp. NBC_00869]WSZ27431.1 thiamine pyrophosphate-dependent enzyme [Streptomyces sp. NBC_00870]
MAEVPFSTSPNPYARLRGDCSFHFTLEELEVGAQHCIPYVDVLVNNSYLGLIRQAQRNFDIDFQVNLEFENLNSPELGVYGVDHVKVVEGLGCKTIRVTEPDALLPAFEEAKKLAAEHRVPVVVEAILERVTNISMSGPDIASVNGFEDVARCYASLSFHFRFNPR